MEVAAEVDPQISSTPWWRVGSLGQLDDIRHTWL